MNPTQKLYDQFASLVDDVHAAQDLDETRRPIMPIVTETLTFLGATVHSYLKRIEQLPRTPEGKITPEGVASLQEFSIPFSESVEVCRKRMRIATLHAIEAMAVAKLPSVVLKRLFKKNRPSAGGILNDARILLDYASRINRKLGRQAKVLQGRIIALRAMAEDIDDKQVLKELIGSPETASNQPRLEQFPYYIDLDQAAAALVCRSKRTLERHKGLPVPAIKGKGGKKNEWIWSELRPWLERKYDRKLPDCPPHIAARRH